MEINQQCCPNSACADVSKIGNGNVKVYSHKEQRYYCATCGQRFRQSRDTLFYKLRTPRQDFIEAVGMLAERCSLRAIARIKHAKLATILHWLDIAGAQAASVGQQLTRNLSLTQVQIDELWTFVKKSLVISTRTSHARESATIGYGPPSRCRAACASRAISAKNEARLPPPLLSSKYGHEVMVKHHSSPVTSCPPMSRHWWLITASLSRHPRNVAGDDHVSHPDA